MSLESRFTDISSAVRDQVALALRVEENAPETFDPKLVCGLDAAYSGEYGVGVAAIWSTGASRLTEVQTVERKILTSYVPGFFSYREGPLVVAAARKLVTTPDAYLVDGHGKAHPRRFGLACHVGLALKAPTVGVAKNILWGKKDGGYLVAEDGSKLARMLRTAGQRMFYISIGHMIDLEQAFNLVNSCLVQGHVAPLRAAHIVSRDAARKFTA